VVDAKGVAGVVEEALVLDLGPKVPIGGYRWRARTTAGEPIRRSPKLDAQD
jgi:hypothetical protein